MAVNWIPLLVALAAMPAAAQTIAITHAEAWTMQSAEPMQDATIVIQDGKIVSITPGGAAPQGATLVDARGKPVTPGLVNGATQIGLVEVSSSADTHDQASTDERSPSFDPSRALNGNSTLIDLARADGITRALVYPSPSRRAPLGGEPAFIRLRGGADILARSNVAVHAVIGGGAWDRVGSRAQQWALLRKLLADAQSATAKEDRDNGKRGRRHQSGGGVGTASPRPKNAEDPLQAVVLGQIPLGIQTDRESDIRQAIQLAQDFGIRVILVGGAEAWRAANALAAAKIAVVLDPLSNLPDNFDELGVRQDSAAILTRAGVTVSFGTVGGRVHSNYNAGMALREGAGISVANGLPYIDGLRAVTVNPLAIWGEKGGLLSPGADADLVVWDGDPLEPSTNAVAVIIEGRQVPNRSRHDLLAERYRDNSR